MSLINPHPNQLDNYRSVTAKLIPLSLTPGRICLTCGIRTTTKGGKTGRGGKDFIACASCAKKASGAAGVPGQLDHPTPSAGAQGLPSLPMGEPAVSAPSVKKPKGWIDVIPMTNGLDGDVLYFGKAKKWHRFIAMRPGVLQLTQVDDDHWQRLAFEPSDRATKAAVELFYHHPAGHGDKTADFMYRAWRQYK